MQGLPNPSGFERTLSFLSDVKKVGTLGELAGTVAKATAEYGVSSLLAGFIPATGTLGKEQLQHVLLAQWPEAWAATYFENGFLFQDPTIRLVRSSAPTFVWSQFSRDLHITRGEQAVMEMAREFDLLSGCTVPLISLDGRCAGFSFAGSVIDDAPEAKGAMTLVASYAFARAVELRNDHLRTAARLTSREREVIGWISAGKTDWEISVIFGVSVKAVEKHIYNVRLKLGAVNRAHAVAEAFRQG